MVLLDEVLSDLRLARSTAKTWSFDNVYSARANLLDPALSSLTELLKLDKDIGMGAVRAAYDSQIRENPEVEGYRFR